MTIKRDRYLRRLIEARNDGFVKIVTGVRRCGKSFLLFKLFRRHLIATGMPRDNIVTFELDKRKDARFRDPDALYLGLSTRLKKLRGAVVVIIDEIQECRRPKGSGAETQEGKAAREHEFYDVLNEFRERRNVDIYVTGSNSRLLVKDVATQFRGRGETIQINPLTFSEYYSAVKGDKSDALNDYLVYGGMPELLSLRSAEAKRIYLDGLFKTIYFKDIAERSNLRDDYFLGAVTDVLMSAAGSLTNPTKLANHMATVLGRVPDHHTVRKYIDLLAEAYLFKKADRYNIKGRSYLDFPSKYYPVDVGLRNARLNFRQTEVPHLMECVVYNELIARGASVDVGLVETEERRNGKREKKQLEVDFVVNLGMGKVYIQSAYSMPDEEKREQETRSLRKIGDSFGKLVIVGDRQPFYTDEDGISHVGLMEFLLDQSILDRMAVSNHI